MAEAKAPLHCPKCPAGDSPVLTFQPLFDTKNMAMKVDGQWVAGFRAWQGMCSKCGWKTNIFMSMR